MMVWVLTGEMAYEGSTLLGIYSTRAAAENAWNEHSSGEESYDPYGGYAITEIEVDVSPTDVILRS